jgi:hypothetical protein
MTLALAAVCTDGVVIVEDTALTRMDTFELLGHDEKLRGVIRNVIFGYEGQKEVYDIFVKCVVGEVVMLRDDVVQHYTIENMISKFSNIVCTIRSITPSFRLSILVARQFPGDGKSDLNLLLENGEIKLIQIWETIGNGKAAADPLVKNFWEKKGVMNMRTFAELSHCIIRFIEKEELVMGVGVGANNPSIIYLENGADIDMPPTTAEFNSFEGLYESYSKEFRTILGPEFSSLKESTKKLRRHFQINP